jgi:hypothetical protein
MQSVYSSIALVLLSSGCAHAPPAQHIRFSDAARSGSGIDWTRPIVLEFQPGDKLPVHISLSDQLFGLSPAAPQLELVAKRRGFIRIEPGRLTSSLTADNFETRPLAPGAFSFGLSLTRQGTWLALAVTTPRHAEPTSSRVDP